MVTEVKPDSWYLLDGGFGATMILCSDCLKKDLADTASGKLTGDMAVSLDEVEELIDADTEPYQCDDCLLQNEAYEDV